MDDGRMTSSCSECGNAYERIVENLLPGVCRDCKQNAFYNMLRRETYAEIKRSREAAERKAKYRKQATGSPVSRTRQVK